MITLKKNSRLLAFTYFFGGDEYKWDGFQTSLCRIFWRTVAMCVLTVAVFCVLTFIVGAIVIASWKTKGFLPGFAAVIALGVWLTKRNATAINAFMSEKTDIATDKIEAAWDKVSGSLIWQMLRAVKGKVCPIVKFED